MKAGRVEPTLPEPIREAGLGKKTLEIICIEKGISLSEALFRLRQKGIEATVTEELKEIASKQHRTPLEILQIVEGKD